MRRALLCIAAAFPMLAEAGTIYLCRAYSGGTFWASHHCRQHNALIERIVTVPDGLPFDQQVDLGNQQLRSLNSQSSGQTRNTTIINNNGSQAQGNKAQCESLDQAIEGLDAAARAPQSLQSLDRIRAERKNLRDRQYQLRC